MKRLSAAPVVRRPRLHLARLLASGAALAVLAACATGPGGQSADGCRTIFVFLPGGAGGVQPLRTCDGLPRDGFQAQTLTADAAATGSLAVSREAAVTAAPDAPEGGYASANAMIQAGDMSAFMARVRADYAEGKNKGAWGYAVIDALAAGQTSLAREILAGMSEGQQPQFLGAVQLRPWVEAFSGETSAATESMAGLDRALPAPTLLGHRALLAEALGDTAGAMEIYSGATQTLSAPDKALIGTPAYFTQYMAFQRQRGLALRQAELLRALDRNDEAIALLQRLLDASEGDDGYVADQLSQARQNKGARELLTLRQAMSLALTDQAGLVEERQDLMSAMVGRGDRPPFNHLLSSMRQSALLLDPANEQARLSEVNHLYSNGEFPAALRLAQLGEASPTIKAALLSTAGFAALELGSEEALRALVKQGLDLSPGPEAKLSAAAALINANDIDGATKLANEVLAGRPTDIQRNGALLTKAQARAQAGDIEGAVKYAREAVELKDDEGNRQFLASMLIRSENREEGLQIMRNMLRESPGDTAQMNNLGYALVDGHRTDAELDEGFRMLKEASRITPDEANLLDSLGWAYYHYGDFAEARRYIELALENYLPFHNWELEDHMGDVLWRQGDEAGAKARWEMALKARPPADDAERLRAKVASGLTTPAPVKRAPPDVPLTRQPPPSSGSEI